MAELSPVRRLLKRIHPEGIPWPGCVFYNAISTTNVFQRHYELIARDIVNYCEAGCLLDIGTGPGWLLLKIHQQAPRMRLVGVDLSGSMIAKARKNMTDAGLAAVIELREANASYLPFAAESFDIVVSTGSIHHWKEPTAALNDIHRVLRPGAYALIYDMVSDTPAFALERMVREFGRLKMAMFWVHGFTEPFYDRQNFEVLSRPTLFRLGQTRFVGVLCCLMLKKEAEEQ
jgi:ubiquinone/menaquinone biosynthesis C-methylase UbiE